MAVLYAGCYMLLLYCHLIGLIYGTGFALTSKPTFVISATPFIIRLLLLNFIFISSTPHQFPIPTLFLIYFYHFSDSFPFCLIVKVS